MELYNFDFGKKIFYHPESIVEYKRGRRPFPILLEVDLTNRCNHCCSFCFYAEHINNSKDSLDSEVIQDRLAEARSMGTKAISFTGGGEPMIHKHFLEVLQTTKGLGVDVGLVTNGSLISEKNLDALISSLQWIRISIGGGDRDSYRAVQGADHFERVMQNIYMLSERKTELEKPLSIGVRMLVTPENVNSVVNLVGFLQGTNINHIQLAPDQFTCDEGKFWYARESQKIFNEAADILEQTNIRLLTSGYVWLQDQIDYPRTCYTHFFQNSIQADGNVTFCKNARGKDKYYIGNIYQNTMKEIWEGEKTKEIEKGVRPNNCGLYCKNMALNISMEETLYPTPDMSPNFVG